jgi:hypothetical protein
MTLLQRDTVDGGYLAAGLLVVVALRHEAPGRRGLRPCPGLQPACPGLQPDGLAVRIGQDSKLPG